MAEITIPEEWRIVADFPNYEVSSLGRVRTILANNRSPAGTILRSSSSQRYLTISGPYRVGQPRLHSSVHALICTAFHGPRPTPLHHAAHWDGDRRNNAASNLRWATPKENRADTARHGRISRGETHSRHILTTKQVIEIKILLATTANSIQEIASLFHISRSAINLIKSGKNWSHII